MGICVLGPPSVEGDGVLARRDRLVLGVLAVRRGRVVMPDQVADAVWGDRPPASWQTQVQICVGRLRKVLEAGSIETVAGGYRMTLSGDEVDADRFEQLVTRGRTLAATGEPERAAATFSRALGLWRGRPFEDLSAWEPASSEAARLEELRRSVEEELADARLETGEHREVAATAEALVAAEPLRERRWAILALAQYRCGRQADALRTLARARRLLVEQLGIDPGPELTVLEAALLRQDETLAAPELSPTPIAGDCPYKGLAAYDVGDAEGFFGRDAEVAACLDRLRSSPLLVVAGPSGCGKSSLARAGLVPALARQGRPSVVLVPSGDPDAAMTQALASADGTPVVVVDQFEELFAVRVDPLDRAAAFCRRLTAHASRQAPVVVCVRADHLVGLSIDAGFARLAEQGLHLVSPLTGDLLREAIELPAAQAGLRLEPGLVDLLVRDCDGEPGAMPLLSHALAETWRRRDGHVLTVEGYRDSGGIRGAVARSADRLYDSLPAEQRAMLRGLMLRLVTPSVDGDPVRCRVPTRSLVGDRQRENVVALLVRARLVTAGADTVELAHEALARAWPRLQTWLDEDAAGQRILRHLVAAAAGWDTLGRPDSELYRGARLDTALEWRSTTRPDLTELESEFLDASRALAADANDALIAQGRRDARQNRRLRRALAAAALLAVLALVAGLGAYRQRQHADTARRASALQALVSNSVAVRPIRPELAALLAVEAHRLAPSAATESALFGLFTAFPGIGRRIELQAPRATNGAMIFPDGNTLVSADERGVVRLVDVATGAVRTQLGGTGPPSLTAAFAVTDDGRYLAVALVGTEPHPREHSMLTVWDLHTERRRFPDVDLAFRADDLEITADGSQLAVGGGHERRVQVRDAATGRLHHELAPIPLAADIRIFFPDQSTVSLAYVGDDRLIVGSKSGPIRFIDPHSGDELGRIEGPSETGEGSIVVSPDGRSMVTNGRRGMMRYGLPSGRRLWPGPAAVECWAGSAVAEHIGVVLCGEFGGRILTVDLDTGGFAGPRFENQRGGAHLVTTPDGRTMLTLDVSGYTVWRLDGSGLVHHVLPYTGASAVSGETESERLAPVEDAVVTGYLPAGDAVLVARVAVGPDARPAIDVVDARSGAVRDRLEGGVVALPTPDRTRLITLFDDNTVAAYDLSRGERVGERVRPGFGVDKLLVEGDRVYAWNHQGGDDGARRPPESGGRLAGVDLARGTVGGPDIQFDSALLLAVGAPGAIYTVSEDGDPFVFERRDQASGAAVAAWDHDFPVHAVAGDDVVIANTAFGELLTLDPDTLRETGELLPATGSSLATMALSDDERRLLVLGDDRGVRLYDVGARTQVGTEITIDRVPGAALRADGHEAAVATRNGIVIWDLDPERWVEGACGIAGRNLTRAEWSTHIGDLAPYRPTCPQYAPAG